MNGGMYDVGCTWVSMIELVKLSEVKVHFHVRRGLFTSLAVRAVDGVSLGLHKGEAVAVVGESGSGKTTLGRLSLRLAQPTSGRIFFDGKDITDLEETELALFRRRAQAIFQDPYSSINPFMRVYQTVEEPLIVHKVSDSDQRRQLVNKALEDVKLTPAEEFASKFPHTLSGGQRQRVGIARAIVLSPEYVVADEPVSMIDASSRIEILRVLKNLQEKYGTAFLYITHDMATAKYFSDMIAVMYLGRIIELGLSREVINDALHQYTKALIQAVPEPDPKNRFRERQVIAGEPPSPIDVPRGCRFHPRCPRFMKDKCDVTDPLLQEVTPNHLVACHLFSK